MRRTGFGVQFDLEDIPEKGRVTSPDGRRVAAFWIGREREDRYDDDTVYEIAVWDVATGRELESYTRIHNASHATGEERGKPVSGVRFTDSGELEIVFADGSTEPAKPPTRELPPWLRRDPSLPPPRLFEEPDEG